ncbi:MAG: protocatechuate 3,4-dioxygenase subunit alpha [Burkholderiales bacterium]
MTFPSTTPSQTVGPFFHIGFDGLYVNDLTAAGVSGEGVTISGKIFDGDGKPISDAVIEIWQADAQGQYPNTDSATFKGFGRMATDEEGAFRFVTIKPGRVVGADGELQAPHINVSVFMRGLLKRVVTRIYFADEASNNDDAVLKSIASERCATLFPKKIAGDSTKLEWNIVVQGQHETVFFDC